MNSQRQLSRETKTRFAKIERGSFTLQALFSTMGGVMFVMLLVNLTRYVAATNAVEQAARKAARCVTPTDPACVTYSSTGASADLDWYGQVVQAPQPDEFMADRYAYTAQMISQTWKSDYTTYETQIVRPQVTWADESITLKTFTPALNAYESRYATLARRAITSATPATFIPRYQPNFPSFNQGYEDGGSRPMIDRPEGDWEPHPTRVIENAPDGTVLSRNAQFEFRPLSMHVQGQGSRSSSKIESGHTVLFESETFNIPVIQEEGVGVCESGHNCGVGKLASRQQNLGGDEDIHAWYGYAHVAIKAFSAVRASNAQIKWGTDTGADGLEIHWWNPKKAGAKIHIRELGGRTWEPVDGEQSYHLVLRGPQGANGAGSLAAAIKLGKVHDDISIPRGNSFKIIARFSAKSGDIDRVTPHIQFYFDEYYQTSAATAEAVTTNCGEARLTPGSAPVCPESCNISGVANSDTECVVVNGTERAEPSCINDGQMFVADIPEGCQPDLAYRTAVCSDSEVPPNSILDSALASLSCEATVCGWTEKTGERSEVTVGTSSCPSPKRTSHTETCALDRILEVGGQYGDLESCPLVSAKAADSLATVEGALSSHPDSRVTLAPLSKRHFHWSGEERYSPERWVGSWLAPNGKSPSDTVPSPAVRVQTKSAVLEPWYARVDGAQPTAADFHYEAPHNADSPVPPEEFYSLSRVSLAKQETKQVSHTYPFQISAADGGDYDVPYWGKHTPNPTADYDRDCDYEDTCSAEHREFQSEEEMLRSYAAAEIPEAINPELVFQYSKSAYLRTDFFDSVAALESALREQGAPTTCTPAKSRCGKEAVVKTVYLGRLPASSDPDGPAACKSGGAYSRCYSEAPAGTVFAESQTAGSVSLELAQNVGRNEIARLLSVSKVQDDCGEEPSCAEIRVSSSNGAKEADVSVSYNLPLSFPLAQILGKESLQIRHQKKEAREFELAGR